MIILILTNFYCWLIKFIIYFSQYNRITVKDQKFKPFFLSTNITKENKKIDDKKYYIVVESVTTPYSAVVFPSSITLPSFKICTFKFDESPDFFWITTETIL